MRKIFAVIPFGLALLLSAALGPNAASASCTQYVKDSFGNNVCGPASAVASPASGFAVAGFNPTGQALLSVSNVSSNVALGTNSTSTPPATTALVRNTGTVDARIALGGSGVAATTSSFLIQAGTSQVIQIGSQTFIAAITAASTTTLDISTGTGTPAVAGSSSTGGGGSVTQGTTPWIVAGGGTAGAPGTAALTIQGIGSGTPVPMSAASLPLPANAAQETGGNLATLAGAVASNVVQSNTKQVNGVTTLAGAGAVGTGSQRVAVGQDTTTIAGSAPGTAGTPSANVVSVQGVASGTVLPENQTQVNSVAVLTGTGAVGTGAQRIAVGTDTATIAGSAPGTAGSASANVVTVQGVGSMTKLLVTPDSVALPANQSVNTAQVNGVTTLTGTGAVGTGAQRVAVGTDTATIAGSAPGTAGSASTNVVTVQGVASMTKLLVTPDNVVAQASTTSGQVGGLVQEATTTGNPTYTTAQTNPLSGDTSGRLRVIDSGGTIQNIPGTTNGLSFSTLEVANNTTSVAVKASAGQLYGIEAFNNGTTIAYVKLYNTAQGSVTCGTPTPLYVGMIPAPAAGGGGYISMNFQGLAFSTAITACVVTGYADNSTGAPAATTYLVNFFYK